MGIALPVKIYLDIFSGFFYWEIALYKLPALQIYLVPAQVDVLVWKYAGDLLEKSGKRICFFIFL